MSDYIPISITIADRNYRIKILPEDESSVRQTVKFINNKILEFRTNYAGKDMQDYIAMVLIWFVSEQAKKINASLDEETLNTKLDEIGLMLEKMENDLVM